MLMHEYAARQQRSQQVLMKLSGLPQVKTLEGYDFNYATRCSEIPDGRVVQPELYLESRKCGVSWC